MSAPTETVETLLAQIRVKDDVIAKLKREISELEDEVDDDAWLVEDDLSASHADAVQRVHRYICEGDMVEAVRELQSAFPELGLRDLATERRLIGLAA